MSLQIKITSNIEAESTRGLRQNALRVPPLHHSSMDHSSMASLGSSSTPASAGLARVRNLYCCTKFGCKKLPHVAGFTRVVSPGMEALLSIILMQTGVPIQRPNPALPKEPWPTNFTSRTSENGTLPLSRARSAWFCFDGLLGGSGCLSGACSSSAAFCRHEASSGKPRYLASRSSMRLISASLGAWYCCGPSLRKFNTSPKQCPSRSTKYDPSGPGGREITSASFGHFFKVANDVVKYSPPTLRTTIRFVSPNFPRSPMPCRQQQESSRIAGWSWLSLR
mmetsp:Transcript_123255/g.343147  ORF Transcript_123255/g.343147 Transcript_123255/m.343147 type:complete len:280 (-) Transcript_123255:117-956(-)